MLDLSADHPITKTLSQVFGAAGIYPLSLTSPLVYKAIRDDNADEMLRLLKKCPAALKSVREGQIAPLFVAVIHGHDTCAEALTKQYPYLLVERDDKGKGVLHFGIELGNFNGDHAETLIRLGANPDLKDFAGDTPLHYAARSFSQIGFTEKLLDNHADINARNNEGETPLIVAAQRNSPELVNFLLLRKVDMDAADDAGITPVMHAIRRHAFDSASCLLSYGAKLDLDYEPIETALRVATTEMHIDFLKLIGERMGDRDREIRAQSEQAVNAITEGTQAPVTAMKPLRFKPQ
ncbi:MAG: ankyrin repeat domain-containing protein [Alphaproteobacteria bacterium]